MALDGAAAWPAVMAALRRAVPVFFSWRVVAMVALPVVAAAMLWALLGYFAFDPFGDWLALYWFGATNGWGNVAAHIVAALVIFFGVMLTVLVAVAVLAMPVLVDAVARRDFQGLARRKGGTWLGSAMNATFAIALYLVLWVLCLVLLSLPPLYLTVSLLLSAWVNQRLFRYDALSEHADASEMGEVLRRARRKLLLLGLVLAPLSLIPLVNLIAPMYAGIAFAYLCLAELAALRRGKEVSLMGDRA